MSSWKTVRRRSRPLALVALLVVLGVTLVGILGYASLPFPSSTAPSSSAPPASSIALRWSDPGVAKLDPKLRRALRRAATDAAADRVQFRVNSGWRSRQDQEQLFREAVSTYGSKAEAARWVAIPGTSAHERGQAVDLGPADATAWLSAHGAAYGLCQIYGNETWHYELRPHAVDRGCPPMYADATQDPRTRATR